MSNHVFDIFNSSSRNSIKVTSKINGGENHFSNNYGSLKSNVRSGIEGTPLRTKSSSGLSIRQPLADRQSLNQLKVPTTVKSSPLKPKEIEKPDLYKYKKYEDTYEDIIPKHKRINNDDIKNILNCFTTPTPRVSLSKKIDYPSIIEFQNIFNKNNNYIFEDDILELSPPKNPFYDEDWDEL